MPISTENRIFLDIETSGQIVTPRDYPWELFNQLTTRQANLIADTYVGSFANTNSVTTTVTSTVTGTISTNNVIGGFDGVTFYNTMHEIDEEEYVNNKEYWDLARQRGVMLHVRTAEETRLAKEAALQLAVKHEKEKKLMLAAEERAKALLIDFLSPEQFRTFQDNNWFIVIGGKTKTRYRIKTNDGIAGNIRILNDMDREIAKLCCHMSYEIPKHDHFLCQKLHLEVKDTEEAFLKLANRTTLAA